jgi:hypothetical protein
MAKQISNAYPNEYPTKYLPGHATLEAAVEKLQNNHYETMLEMLRIFPEEAKSPKVRMMLLRIVAAEAKSPKVRMRMLRVIAGEAKSPKVGILGGECFV